MVKEQAEQKHLDPDEILDWFSSLTIYFGYGLLFVVGHVRDFFSFLLGRQKSTQKDGYKNITQGFEQFYRRRLYHRIHGCWNRPITTCASSHFDMAIRKPGSYRELTDKTQDCINLGSYNYLGFGSKGGPTEKDVLEAVDKWGISTTNSLGNTGRTEIHQELEELVAEFFGVDDSMVFGMGWATNSTAIPSLVGKGSLILSDSLNHNSIVAGCRSSGAKIRVFQHNNVKDLERQILKALGDGQPRTHLRWKKILIIVEGIYSMEGETSPLKEIVEIKNKYKCYLYVDEAHSVGALGKTGRGICDHCGVDPKDVDILMGTFTKSFGAIGGYVAGKQELVSHLRKGCASQYFSSGLSPVCVKQILGTFKIIMGKDGTDIGKQKIQRLHDNSNWLREKLIENGLFVLGAKDSAIIPVIIGHPAKIKYVSEECLRLGLAVVVVGFPATSLLASRVRFCLSSAHTREDLEKTLENFMKVAIQAGIVYF